MASANPKISWKKIGHKVLTQAGSSEGRLGGPGRALGRGHVGIILREIAAEASKKLKEPIKLHPHRLRHTFGALYRAKSGSDTETAAALGPTGLAHISRYVHKSQKEREDAMETIFAT